MYSKEEGQEGEGGKIRKNDDTIRYIFSKLI